MRELVRQTLGAAIGLVGAALIILSLAVVVTTVVLPRSLVSITSSRGEAKKARIRVALDEFHDHVGRYPTTEEGLAALQADPGVTAWSGPYLFAHQQLDIRYVSTNGDQSYWLGAEPNPKSSRTGSSLQIVLHWGDERSEAGVLSSQ